MWENHFSCRIKLSSEDLDVKTSGPNTVLLENGYKIKKKICPVSTTYHTAPRSAMGTHPSSYPTGTGCYFAGGKVAEA
jgi:hypothetical protein